MIFLVQNILKANIANFSFEIHNKESVSTFNTSNSQILSIIIWKVWFIFLNASEKYTFETRSPIHFTQSCKTLKLTQPYVIYVLISFNW